MAGIQAELQPPQQPANVKFAASPGDAGFGYAIFSGDAFAGSFFSLMETDNLLFIFGSVILRHNESLFSCDFDYVSSVTPAAILL